MIFCIVYNQKYIQTLIIWHNFNFLLLFFCRFTFACSKYCITDSCAINNFKSTTSLQQEGIIIQNAHQFSSSKGNSRSKTQVYSTSSNVTNTLFLSSKKRKRMNTVRALDDDSRCSFHFIVEYNSNHKAWFLKYQHRSNKDNEKGFFQSLLSFANRS